MPIKQPGQVVQNTPGDRGEGASEGGWGPRAIEDHCQSRWIEGQDLGGVRGVDTDPAQPLLGSVAWVFLCLAECQSD